MVLQAPSTFTKNGFIYQLVLEAEGVALYQQNHWEIGCVGFEVIILRLNHERAINGKLMRAGVRLPSNEEFGTVAFAYVTKESAMKKFEALVAQKKRYSFG